MPFNLRKLSKEQLSLKDLLELTKIKIALRLLNYQKYYFPFRRKRFKRFN